MTAIKCLVTRYPLALLLACCVLMACLGLMFKHQAFLLGGQTRLTQRQFSGLQQPGVLQTGEVKSSGQDELNQLRMDSFVQRLEAINADSMNKRQLELTIHSSLDQADALCARKLRMGNLDDGGWEVCDDIQVRPVPPCVIYSFGINNDFSFDDDMARLYGCHVYSFDPSMEAKTHNRSERVHFVKLGISGQSFTNDKGWKLYTMADLTALLGHTHRDIAVVKMDVEGSEWQALPNMLESGQLKNVRQLLVEYHARKQTPYKQVRLFQALERAGFKKFYVTKNYHCERKIPGFPIPRTICYEVHYMRVYDQPSETITVT